jgi:hypothetical protein
MVRKLGLRRFNEVELREDHGDVSATVRANMYLITVTV